MWGGMPVYDKPHGRLYLHSHALGLCHRELLEVVEVDAVEGVRLLMVWWLEGEAGVDVGGVVEHLVDRLVGSLGIRVALEAIGAVAVPDVAIGHQLVAARESHLTEAAPLVDHTYNTYARVRVHVRTRVEGGRRVMWESGQVGGTGRRCR